MPIHSAPCAALVCAVLLGVTAAEEAPPKPQKPVPRPNRVVFIVAKDCDDCTRELARLRQPGGEFEGMRSRGWLIGDGPENHVQIVDRDAVPDLVAKLKVTDFPVVAGLENGDAIRSFQHGCTTPLDASAVKIYVIQYQEDNPDLTTLLQAVATQPQAPYYYFAPDTASLATIFNQIAASLSALRLVK